MNLRDWLTGATGRLAQAGVDSPDLDARLLAAHVLSLPPAELPLHGRRSLSPTDLTALEDLLTRRCAREPLQYLVGDTEFYGHRLLCDPRALIPRAETETLVEVALGLIGATGATHVVDVGTGTGAIALALALELPGLRVLATDASPDALALAAENVALHGLSDRVALAVGDYLEPVRSAGWWERTELVVSNPPYVRADQWGALQPEIAGHEPRLALVGPGEDGLGAYRRILTGCAELPALRAVVFEVGMGQAAAVADMLQTHLPACDIMVREDLGGIERVVGATALSHGRRHRPARGPASP